MSLTRSERDAARWERSRALLDTRPFIGRPCPYCGTAMTRPAHGGRMLSTGVSRDHLLPAARGGSDFPHNITAVCLDCNLLKGELLLTEWLVLLADDADPRLIYVEAFLNSRPDLRRRCEAVEAREHHEIEVAA